MTQTDKDKLTELQNIRTALDIIAQDYCSNFDELQTIVKINARLWLTEVKPLLDKKKRLAKEQASDKPTAYDAAATTDAKTYGRSSHTAVIDMDRDATKV